MDDHNFGDQQQQLNTSLENPGTWGDAVREMFGLGVHKMVWDGLLPNQVRDFGHGAGMLALARADYPDYD